MKQSIYALIFSPFFLWFLFKFACTMYIVYAMISQSVERKKTKRMLCALERGFSFYRTCVWLTLSISEQIFSASQYQWRKKKKKNKKICALHKYFTFVYFMFMFMTMTMTMANNALKLDGYITEYLYKYAAYCEFCKFLNKTVI